MPSLNAIKIETKIKTSIQDNTIFAFITDRNTHIDRHKYVSDTRALERTLDEVQANSRFENPELIDTIIKMAILQNAISIAEWVAKASQGDTKDWGETFPEDMFGIIGSGFMYDNNTNLVKEYTTNSVRIVLRRQMTSRLGFTLVTAYPDIEMGEARSTRRSLDDLVKTTHQYIEADPVGKAYLLYRTDPRNKSSIAYIRNNDPRESVMYLHIDAKNGLKHIVKIKEQGATLKTVHVDNQEQAVETEYTALRNRLHPDMRFSNQEVRLSETEIRSAVFQNHPFEMKAVSAILKNIKSEMPEERKHLKKQTSSRNLYTFQAKAVAYA